MFPIHLRSPAANRIYQAALFGGYFEEELLSLFFLSSS